jgi:RNA polymerase sigma-70 factor (ECF subfamily)
VDCRVASNLERLYERVGRAALHKTACLVGRRDVAEEIVQGAFAKLWEAQLTFESERSAFAWIYRTCHNAGLDHLRAYATKLERAPEGGEDAAPSAEDPGFAAIEARQWLAERLAGLSEREGQVLAYRVLDGMLQREIAEVMGLSRKTVVRVCEALDAKLGLADDRGGPT